MKPFPLCQTSRASGIACKGTLTLAIAACRPMNVPVRVAAGFGTLSNPAMRTPWLLFFTA
jgi:hypothetical protein